MPGLRVLFLIVAVVLFVVAAAGVPTGRFSVMAAGLAFFAAAFLVG
jgi:Na+/H+-dicarboxylate symporter